MSIDPRVHRVCDEFSIRIIDGRAYPETGETRAVGTMDRILKARGYDHFRMVMMTLGETENNQGSLDEYLFWAVSDLVKACEKVIETDPCKWLECFDAAPVGELQYIARDLSGITHQRHAIAGMLYERIVRAFGPHAVEALSSDERKRA
jgi:hypothetical protein